MNLGAFEVVTLVAGSITALVLVARSRTVNESAVDSWAAEAGIELTDQTRPVLARYLHWVRRGRALGATLGAIAGLVVSALGSASSAAASNALNGALLGYLLGALLAEITFRSSRGDGAAVLLPRRLQDYEPRSVRIILRFQAVLAVGLFVAYANTSLPQRGHPAPTLLAYGALSAFAVAVAVATELLQRAIVNRPQRVTGEDELILDDALRSSGVRVLAGAAIGILLLVLSAEGNMFSLLLPEDHPANGVFFGLAMFLFVAAIATWLRLKRPHGFRVGRSLERTA